MNSAKDEAFSRQPGEIYSRLISSHLFLEGLERPLSPFQNQVLLEEGRNRRVVTRLRASDVLITGSASAAAAMLRPSVAIPGFCRSSGTLVPHQQQCSASAPRDAVVERWVRWSGICLTVEAFSPLIEEFYSDIRLVFSKGLYFFPIRWCVVRTEILVLAATAP